MKKSQQIKNNKSFGILFFIVFLVIGFWPNINGEEIRIWSISLSLLFFSNRIMISLMFPSSSSTSKRNTCVGI